MARAIFVEHRITAPKPRVELILGAIVRASVEVTAGACLTVTADLLVPEERLAQDLQGFPSARLWDTGVRGTRIGSDEGGEMRGIGHRHGLEGVAALQRRSA